MQQPFYLSIKPTPQDNLFHPKHHKNHKIIIIKARQK